MNTTQNQHGNPKLKSELKQMKDQNEQIDEIAKLICTYPQCINYNAIGGCKIAECQTVDIAAAIYNAGFRKQSVGEWEKVRNHKECSKCGYNAPYKKIKAGYHLQDLTKYCPNCGAKMKGGAE